MERLDKLKQHVDLVALLGLIHDELNPECGVPAEIYGWAYGEMSDKEMIQTLLPLCKLLNRLFFEHAPLET